MKEDFVEKEGCNSFCGDGFLRGTKNHPLSKPMVNHDQKRVEAIRRGKIHDEVTGNLLEWASGNRADRSKGGMVECVLDVSASRRHTRQHTCGQRLQD